jgi:hypothetical protein
MVINFCDYQHFLGISLQYMKHISFFFPQLKVGQEDIGPIHTNRTGR